MRGQLPNGDIPPIRIDAQDLNGNAVLKMIYDSSGYSTNPNQRSNRWFVTCRKPTALLRKAKQLGVMFLTVDFKWGFGQHGMLRVALAVGARITVFELSRSSLI